MIVAAQARTVEPGPLPLLRGAALPLALFSGVEHGGAAVVVGLLVLGVVPEGTGGALLLLWAAVSFVVSLAGYRRMEDGRRHEKASLLAVSGMPRLASRVIALYLRPVEDPAISQVFELYRRAQKSLERGDERGAEEAIEWGVALADGLLEGPGSAYGDATEPGDSDRDEEAKKRGAGSWNQ